MIKAASGMARLLIFYDNDYRITPLRVLINK
jgi:hypothetical protein